MDAWDHVAANINRRLGWTLGAVIVVAGAIATASYLVTDWWLRRGER